MSVSVWKRVTTIGIGHMTYEAFSWVFDFVLYPAVFLMLGPKQALLVMIPLSLGWDYWMVSLYNHTTADWLGFEFLYRMRKKVGTTLWAKTVRSVAGLANFLLLPFFVWWDPPRAFLLVRGRRAGNSFTPADWAWFFGINLVGNLIWILMLIGISDALSCIFGAMCEVSTDAFST